MRLLQSALPVDVLSEALTPSQHIQHAKFKKFISLNDLRIALILISVLITETTLYLPPNPAARPLTGTRRDGITAAVVSLHRLPVTVIQASCLSTFLGSFALFPTPWPPQPSRNPDVQHGQQSLAVATSFSVYCFIFTTYRILFL